MQHFKPDELAPDVRALYDQAVKGLPEAIDKAKQQRFELHKMLNANLAQQEPLRAKEREIREKIKATNRPLSEMESKLSEAIHLASNTNPKMAKAMLQVLVDG